MGVMIINIVKRFSGMIATDAERRCGLGARCTVPVVGLVISVFALSLAVLTGTPSAASAALMAAGEGGALSASSPLRTSVAMRLTDASSMTTSMSVDPSEPDGRAGWYVAWPTVSFSCDETATTFWSLDGEAGPWQLYVAPFVVTRQGALDVAFYSVDELGGQETTRAATLNIDTEPPTQPTMLSATVTQNSATVTWVPSIDLSSGVDYYEVRRDGSVVGTSTIPSVTLTDLPPETPTAVTVRAVDVAGNESADSEPLSVITLASEARPPAIVYVRRAAGNAVQVNWGETTGTVGAVSYRVYRSVAGGPLELQAAVAQPYPGSWVDTSLIAPAFAQYAVSVVDDRGEGPLSEASAASELELAGLASPRGLSAVQTTEGVRIAWDARTGAASYRVYRSLTSTDTPGVLSTVPSATASYVDTTTAPGGRYWYGVAAIDGSGTVSPVAGPLFVRVSPLTQDGSPHGPYLPEGRECSLCHRTHDSDNEIMVLSQEGADEVALCLTCHDGTTGSNVLQDFADPARPRGHAVGIHIGEEALRCVDCHVQHGPGAQDGARKLLYGPDEERTGDSVCYRCHGEDASQEGRGDLRVFETSGHRTSVPAPTDASGVVCLGCHEGHPTKESALVPYAEDQQCLWCHSAGYSLDGATDIESKLAGEGPDTRHDLLGSDQLAAGSMISCANCHEPHASSPETPTVDPDSPTTADGWSGSVTALCLRCHDGTLPTSDETSGWASAPLASGSATQVADIASTWANSVHGAATSGSATLRGDMGYSVDSELGCETCHDPHGSGNKWALAESVVATGGPGVVQGLSVVKVDTGADLRFFCGACHVVGPSSHPGPSEGGADLSQWPLDCTAAGCHSHVGGGL